MNESLGSLADRIAALSEQAGGRLPPVDSWQPALSGDIDIRITAAGEWLHEGRPFQRAALVKLFASILRRDGDAYFLVTPAEKWRIAVEDVPFKVIGLERLSGDDGQALLFETTTGDRVAAGPAHPLRVAVSGPDDEPRPYLAIRGGMEGLLSRAVYVELCEMAEAAPEGGGWGVISNGTFFLLA